MSQSPELVTTLVPEEPSIWSTLKEAVTGSGQDFTRAPIGRAIVLLAVPMVLEMIMESVFAVTDVFFVGRLGANAVAIVGYTESWMTVIYAVLMGLSIGATATVARRFGEGDPDAAARAAVQSVVLGLVIAGVFSTIGIVYGPALLRVMGASDEVVDGGSGFARVMIGGGGTAVTLLFVINAVFRGAGDAAIAMRVLWFANAINIVLGPCLVFGVGPFPKLGVIGAAIGTSVGRTCGVLLQIYFLAARSDRIRIRRVQLALDRVVMRSILRISGTGMFQSFVGTASWMGIVRILSGFGSAAVAGNTFGIRLIIFALLPSLGVSNAAATLVGQNLGAGHAERAEEAAWRAGLYSTLCLAVVSLSFLLFAPAILGVFTADPEVARYGIHCLRIIAVGFLFYGYGGALTASFNGAGDTRTPTIINVVCLWLCELPLAWLLAYPAGIGPEGAFIAVSIAFASLTLVSAWVFKKGNWKTRRV